MSDEQNTGDGDQNWDELADFLGAEGASDQLEADDEEAVSDELSGPTADESPVDAARTIKGMRYS